MNYIHPSNKAPVISLFDTGVRADDLIYHSFPTVVVPETLISPSAPLREAAARAVMLAARSDRRGTDRALDQHYTHPEVARFCLGVAQNHFDFFACQVVEPSAGDGSFFKILPTGTVAFDVEPKAAGIMTADFLSVQIESVRPIFTIGNPPFGRQSELAVRFFNHAASFSAGIGLVLPRTFRKATVLRRIDRNFHLVHEVELPPNAFLFQGKPFNAPAVFQVWARRSDLRDLPHTQSSHPDFDFTGREEGDFVLQRVGANAGNVHHNFALKKSSHYFIHTNVEGVEATMVSLRPLFARVAANTAGKPSLARSEIVALYRAKKRWRVAINAVSQVSFRLTRMFAAASTTQGHPVATERPQGCPSRASRKSIFGMDRGVGPIANANKTDRCPKGKRR